MIMALRSFLKVKVDHHRHEVQDKLSLPYEAWSCIVGARAFLLSDNDRQDSESFARPLETLSR
jgi:hypothetical protein